ncbi:MAG: hypothetical protein Q7R64_01575 [bacterium]|nr:hypothetical protein [bacterium]
MKQMIVGAFTAVVTSGFVPVVEGSISEAELAHVLGGPAGFASDFILIGGLAIAGALLVLVVLRLRRKARS